ncbi:MAG: hypothetical protein VSS75_028990 [Candidatus Parabeggiatoa sp.]|nr:hypothetical protein [Candidatus Parabeggiatoa sp.]
MSTEPLVFNGIDGASGDYLQPPLTPEQVSKMAQGEKLDKAHLDDLEEKINTEPEFDVMAGIDPKNIAETGWGVIFAYGADPTIKEALSELLQHRQQQATQQHEHYYQEYTGTKAYRPGESKNQFLGRHNEAFGPADPDKMPYYLLIVGDPETIPYRFQYQLDIQYAVGRLYFETLDEYAQYAHNVVAAETGQLFLPRRASFFGVRNSGDRATQLSADQLIAPLADWAAKDQPDWQIQTFLKEEATKAQLEQLLGGNDTPSLLFTASHGMSFSDSRQLPHQGALLCQNWPGPGEWRRKRVPEDFYFSADDVSNDAGLLGLISFHFACYGAGTPHLDEFAHGKYDERLAIAPHAFIAQLPRRLLSHPKGGALATVGHVDRAWGYSFFSAKAGPQLTVFKDTLKRLMEGYPIGSAIDKFNVRYAEISSDLNAQLEEIKYGARVNDFELSKLWTANNDARNYAIIGDPAVRLMLGDTDDSKCPIIDPVTFQPTPKTEQPQNTELKQAKNRLTEALEQFILLADKEEQFKTATSSAKGLVDELKTLS